MVDIEHGALGAFEQDALAMAPGRIQLLPDHTRIRQNLGRHVLELRQQFTGIDFRFSEAAPERVVMEQQPFHPTRQHVWFGQIPDADRAARGLVLIGRDDAAPGGSDLGLSPGLFKELSRLRIVLHRQDLLTQPSPAIGERGGKLLLKSSSPGGRGPG